MPNVMLERDLRAHSAAQALSGPVIFDRGTPDIIGYLTLSGLPVPPQVAAAAKAARYNASVFLAPYWDEIFSQDTERKQTRAEAEATGAVMCETYTALGYEITELPRTDITSRADFVYAQLAL
ncbi:MULTISPECIES: AAA family ATPase [Pseudooceanicola]|uniref:AAA family ATPase n=1 Tax=Pseudooceanicola TaxID=1679449 RepID=UPI001F3C0725|nr:MULTISPECIES: AAA family ATPase [Pseudooceanicola]